MARGHRRQGPEQKSVTLVDGNAGSTDFFGLERLLQKRGRPHSPRRAPAPGFSCLSRSLQFVGVPALQILGRLYADKSVRPAGTTVSAGLIKGVRGRLFLIGVRPIEFNFQINGDLIAHHRRHAIIDVVITTVDHERPLHPHHIDGHHGVFLRPHQRKRN